MSPEAELLNHLISRCMLGWWGDSIERLWKQWPGSNYAEMGPRTQAGEPDVGFENPACTNRSARSDYHQNYCGDAEVRPCTTDASRNEAEARPGSESLAGARPRAAASEV